MRPSEYGANWITTLSIMVSPVSRSRVSEPGIIQHILVGLHSTRKFVNLKKNMESKAWWTPDSPEYNDALLHFTQRKYRRAVDKLECLVVQRLFEMTKLGMSGVGMPQ